MSEPRILRPKPARPQFHALAVSPKDRFIAAARSDGVIAMWSPEHGIFAPLASLAGHAGAARAVAFAPVDEPGNDGAYHVLASGGRDGVIRLWHLGDGSRNRAIVRHRSSVLGLAYTPDNRLVSCSEDGTVAIDDIAWTAHGGESVVVVTVSPDGQKIVSGGADGHAILWDLTGGELARAKLDGFMSTAWAATFTPDGERILLATGSAVAEWNPSSGVQRELVVAMGNQRIYAVATVEGRYACGVGDRVGFGNPNARGSGTSPELRSRHEGTISSVKYLADGRLASASEDGWIAIWDTTVRGSEPLQMLGGDPA
jgi:WD40 repeat protein